MPGVAQTPTATNMGTAASTMSAPAMDAGTTMDTTAPVSPAVTTPVVAEMQTSGDMSSVPGSAVTEAPMATTAAPVSTVSPMGATPMDTTTPMGSATTPVATPEDPTEGTSGTGSAM